MSLDLKPVSESDETLLQQAGMGDSQAFEKLYDRLAGPLFGLMKQMLGDEKEAEDVLQEGFVYLWQKAANFDSSRSKAFTWSVMIFRNKAIDRMRSRGRQAKISQAVALELPAVGANGDGRADHEADRHDRATMVYKALSAIPEEQRRLIEFAFLNGDTHETISQKLGLPLGTVKTNIRRGLLRLRDMLKGGVV